MKNIGLTSIAVMALLGQVDKATAIEMNQSNNATRAISQLDAASKPVEMPNAANKTSGNGKNKSKKSNKTSNSNKSK